MGRLTLAGGARIVGSNYLPPLKDRTGLILGTGWSDPDVLKDEGFVLEHEVPFSMVGIQVGNGAGHPNKFLLGTWHERDVLISQGRVHLYQESQHRGNSMLREWMYVFLKMLGKGNQIVITSSVGGLSVGMKTGILVQPTKLVSAHLPQPYLYGNDGEFVMSEHLLWLNHLPSEIDKWKRRELFHAAGAHAKLGHLRDTVHMVVHGPGFGGSFERKLWASWGCDTVGMSLDPELRLIALENDDRKIEPEAGLPQLEVFASLIVTDDHDLPNHQEITAAAKARSPQLGAFLSYIVQHWH